MFLIITVLINLILNIILIPRFGIRGAAVATLISYIFYTVILYVCIKHFEDFPVALPWRVIIKTFSAAGLMGVVLIILPAADNIWFLTVKVIFSLIIYLICLFLSGESNMASFVKLTRKKFFKT